MPAARCLGGIREAQTIKQIKQVIKKYIVIGDVFPKTLGVGSILESWDLKIRIPRRKLRIWSYSQVETRRYRSKYLKIYLLIGFFSYPVFCLIGSLGLMFT